MEGIRDDGRRIASFLRTSTILREANAVGGGYARDQFALRLSFRVSGESLVMLHGEDARKLGPTHANAEPGIAYLSAPGHELVRLRSRTSGPTASTATASPATAADQTADEGWAA